MWASWISIIDLSGYRLWTLTRKRMKIWILWLQMFVLFFFFLSLPGIHSCISSCILCTVYGIRYYSAYCRNTLQRWKLHRINYSHLWKQLKRIKVWLLLCRWHEQMRESLDVEHSTLFQNKCWSVCRAINTCVGSKYGGDHYFNAIPLFRIISFTIGFHWKRLT